MSQVEPQTKKQRNILGMGTLAFSLVFHLSLMLMVGGIVLVEGIKPKGPIGAYVPEQSSIADLPPPDAEPNQPETPQMTQNSEPVPDQPVTAPPETNMPEVIASTSSTSSTFTVPPPIPGAVYNPNAGAVGSGQGGGGGGSGKLAPVKMGNVFGSSEILTASLKGYMYDLKQKADRTPIKVNTDKSGPYLQIVDKFVNGGWDEKVLQEYYCAKSPVSLTQVFIPAMSADDGPRAFHAENEIQPKYWVAHYKGNMSPPQSGKYRFYALADDLIVVRINGNNVVYSDWNAAGRSSRKAAGRLSRGAESRPFAVSSWIELERGQVYPMEILLGEQPGGVFEGYLLVEKDGVEYEKIKDGAPKLQVFQTRPTEIPERPNLGVADQYNRPVPLLDKTPALIFGSEDSGN